MAGQGWEAARGRDRRTAPGSALRVRRGRAGIRGGGSVRNAVRRNARGSAEGWGGFSGAWLETGRLSGRSASARRAGAERVGPGSPLVAASAGSGADPVPPHPPWPPDSVGAEAPWRGSALGSGWFSSRPSHHLSPAARRAISHVSTWKNQAMAALRPSLSAGSWGKSAGSFFITPVWFVLSWFYAHHSSRSKGIFAYVCLRGITRSRATRLWAREDDVPGSVPVRARHRLVAAREAWRIPPMIPASAPT